MKLIEIGRNGLNFFMW